jgi:hypothetical protein
MVMQCIWGQKMADFDANCLDKKHTEKGQGSFPVLLLSNASLCIHCYRYVCEMREKTRQNRLHTIGMQIDATRTFKSCTENLCALGEIFSSLFLFHSKLKNHAEKWNLKVFFCAEV